MSTAKSKALVAPPQIPMHLVNTLTTADELLLKEFGVEYQLLLSPLSLLELPLTLMVRNPTRESALSGRLAPEFCEHSHIFRLIDGSWCIARIEGSAQLGMARGADMEVLVAALTLMFNNGSMGVLEQSSTGMIARQLNVHRTGETYKRIRTALNRYNKTHVLLARIPRGINPTAVLEAVRKGSTPEQAIKALLGNRKTQADELAPVFRSSRASAAVGKGAKKKNDNSVKGELAYDSEQGVRDVTFATQRVSIFNYGEYHKHLEHIDETETLIHRLRVDEFWTNQAANGYLGWIDLPRFLALNGFVAQKMYLLSLGEIEKESPLPIKWDIEWVRSACGAPKRRYIAEFKQLVETALKELQKHEIVIDWRIERTGNGSYNVEFYPGRVLKVAALLAGVTALDPEDTIAMFMVLHSFRMNTYIARRLIQNSPNRLHQVLQYAIYDRATDRNDIDIPSVWIEKAVEGNWLFVGCLLVCCIGSDFPWHNCVSIFDMLFGSWVEDQSNYILDRGSCI